MGSKSSVRESIRTKVYSALIRREYVIKPVGSLSYTLVQSSYAPQPVLAVQMAADDRTIDSTLTKAAAFEALSRPSTSRLLSRLPFETVVEKL
jgi:hypothetical protein